MSAVIRTIMAKARPELALVALVTWLGLGLGCSKLMGDIEIQKLSEADSGTSGADDPHGQDSPRACIAGQVRCQGPVLQACESDGSGWRALQRCASAALCVDDPGEVSRCLERACEPGITCDGAELRECNVDLDGFDLIQTCLSAAHCDAMSGACEETRCVPGEVSCNGATLQRCNDGPTGYDAIATCATAALCDDLVVARCPDGITSCDVSGATCPAPACDAGELRCTGTRLEACNAGRNGWDFVDECVTAGVCTATLANPVAVSCIEPACEPGDVICSPEGARLECNVERTAYSVLISQCQADSCTPTGCQSDPCVVGELSCNGNELQQCQAGPGGSRPSRVTVQACATRQLCDLTLTQPATTPPVCAPARCAAGEFACAGRQMQVCNAARTDFVNHQLCATDGLCQAGAGLGACPVPCSGAACNGSMLRTCNEQLTGLVDTEDCGTAAECDSVNGRCADPCVPGALRCNGTALERCQSRIQGWQRLETCVTPGLCQTSVNQNRLTCPAPLCSVGQHRCTGQTLEVCNADLSGFTPVTTCGAGQICDAQNQQCDICSAGAVSCNGDTFNRCAQNGQSVTTQQCGAGLCSASGGNVGCLQCATPGGFRCDNQGSLFQCSSDQLQENQLDVCRTPQLCRASQGRCLDCDPAGSSRCDGNRVLSCSAQNTESVTQVCDSADLCRSTGPTSATCDQSQCPGPFQCTNQGEVLVCNEGETGYVSQTPAVTCATPALCDVTAPNGCQPPACSPGQRRCDNAVVEVCNDARTDFRPESTCNVGSGLSCVEDGDDASCACTPGAYRCAGGQLTRCNGAGSSFADVPGDAECDGAERVSCSGATVVRDPCGDASHCLASTGGTCAECVGEAECDDGSFCSGVEACTGGQCQAGPGSPCAPGQICSEPTASCVGCLNDGDCAAGQTCVATVCTLVEPPDGGT